MPARMDGDASDRWREAGDRISVGHIGVGRRGSELVEIAGQLKSAQRRMTAVCDLWKVNREKAAAANAAHYGRGPRAFRHLEGVLALRGRRRPS